jgi:ribonuclease P protein component
MIESFGPRERIRRKSEFSELYAKGQSYRGRYFTLVFLPGREEYSRMAAVASRKVGGAVERNKARRRAKDLFRRNKSLIVRPLDILVIARKSMPDAPWVSLRDEYRKAVEAASRSLSER